ncbi:hypothetical protein MRB53_041871 [Persea americana]|nr:hypothetical protein MRB53_041871 [Persea americana]
MPATTYIYTWIDVHRTTASPPYALLFLSAIYFLNRPCVYCSILLGVLVLALFDFSGPWFGDDISHSPETNSSIAESWGLADVTTSLQALASGASSVVAGVFNGSAGIAVDAAKNETSRRAKVPAPEWSGWGLEWARSLSGRRELRIPCFDAVLRL